MVSQGLLYSATNLLKRTCPHQGPGDFTGEIWERSQVSGTQAQETWENPKKTKHVNINIITDYTLPNSFAKQICGSKIYYINIKN